MVQIVLLHSALGRRGGVLRWAEHIRTAGHTVTTPDLYDGEVFDDLGRGVAKRDAIGIPELSRRAAGAVAALGEDLVYAGFSMGAASAQFLAMTRPGARGLVMMHGALPVAALTPTAWPEGLRAQLHYAVDDPWVDGRVVHDLTASVPAGALGVFRYPGSAHLFADDDHPDYRPSAASSMLDRVTEFLATLADPSEDAVSSSESSGRHAR